MFKYLKLVVSISLFLSSLSVFAHDTPLLNGYVKNTTGLLEAEGDLSPSVNLGRNTNVWLHFTIEKPPRHRYGVFEVRQISMKSTNEKRSTVGGSFNLSGLNFISEKGDYRGYAKLTEGTTEYAYLSIKLADSANNRVEVYYKNITGGDFVRSELGDVVYSLNSDPEAAPIN